MKIYIIQNAELEIFQVESEFLERKKEIESWNDNTPIDHIEFEVDCPNCKVAEPTKCSLCESRNFDHLEDCRYECFDCGETFEGKEQ